MLLNMSHMCISQVCDCKVHIWLFFSLSVVLEKMHRIVYFVLSGKALFCQTSWHIQDSPELLTETPCLQKLFAYRNSLLTGTLCLYETFACRNPLLIGTFCDVYRLSLQMSLINFFTPPVNLRLRVFIYTFGIYYFILYFLV